ncbi:unnamed protein product [Acidithrix sp. C25]|nr:unnamed protein product [Acidithrix sp. C25]
MTALPNSKGQHLLGGVIKDGFWRSRIGSRVRVATDFWVLGAVDNCAWKMAFFI